MRCSTCYGGTIMLPPEPGKMFGYLRLCRDCNGTGLARRIALKVPVDDRAVLPAEGRSAPAMAPHPLAA